ncbi:PfkB family carbohydrate kinase [Spiroplasma clarkii]|uniref:PfkB family carbohydrate kinase n=1 Tax=Spiroplasma clarkii TaxID=2139 RepID=UPI001649D71B|nr:PfkB family carbohydrate kinase [Spiroplasma clarkii]
MRFSTTNCKLLKDSINFNLSVGGTELNVAANISNLAAKPCADFYTVLPKNLLGEIVKRHCFKNRVNLIEGKQTSERMGLYFLEPKQGNKMGNVVFDRKNSAFAQSQATDYEIESKKYKIFHTSGIAIGTNPPTILNLVSYFFKNVNSDLYSFDCNYRSSMWSAQEAFASYQKLLTTAKINILFANSWDICQILKLTNLNIDINDKNQFAELCKLIFKKYKSLKYIICTKRNFKSNTETFGYQAMYFDGKDVYESSERYVATIIDRIGCGDAFVAGVLFKLLENSSIKEAVEYGLCCSWLKHSIYGDTLNLLQAEIEPYLEFDNSKLVNR